MFGFIKQVFIIVLSFSESLASIVISLDNQQRMNQPILINLHSNEHSQGLRYYQFAVSVDRSMGSCNVLNDLSNKVCIANKTEDLNLSV